MLFQQPSQLLNAYTHYANAGNIGELFSIRFFRNACAFCVWSMCGTFCRSMRCHLNTLQAAEKIDITVVFHFLALRSFFSWFGFSIWVIGFNLTGWCEQPMNYDRMVVFFLLVPNIEWWGEYLWKKVMHASGAWFNPNAHIQTHDTCKLCLI